jgi:hypothetical protein
MDVAHEFDQRNTQTTWDFSMNMSLTPCDFAMSDGPDLDSIFPTSTCPSFYSDLLAGLPFKLFQFELENNGMCHCYALLNPFARPCLTSFKFQHAYLLTFSGFDLTALGSKTVAKQNFGTSKFVTSFRIDVESSLSNTTNPKRSVQYFQPKALLQSFRSLIPGEVSEESCGNDANLIAKDAMFETNFTRLLVFSIANGFAGLGQIPIGSILKFLSIYGNTGVLFARVLKANSSYVATSLAENLFKVAIEAQEVHIVKHLLETHLLQINDIVCEARGEKLTAVERVAQLHDLKIMEVLLDAHADVNKTFGFLPTNGGPLGRLINGIRPGETLSPDIMSLVQALLQAGAKVQEDLLHTVIQHMRHSELAFCLLSNFLLTHDTDLISDGMLSFITLGLEEEQASKSTEKILQACERLHKGSCLEEFVSKVEWALVQSAKRGHLQVVKILLPHSRDLHRALSASLRSGRREIIDAILAKETNFNAPAHSIDIENTDLSDYADLTTPLAEAIRTQVDDLIHLCEEAGALDYLHLSGHFQATFTAAAMTGNLPYIRKLLKYRPWPNPREMFFALAYSIQNGHDDISHILLKAGASVSHVRQPYSELKSPLCAAILQRNARLVRAILGSGDLSLQMGYHEDFRDSSDSGLKTGHHIYSAVPVRRSDLEEAIKWGDHSIILDLHFTFPGEKMQDMELLEKTLRNRNEDFLIFLIDHDLVDNLALTRCLPGPITSGDTAMVIRLIELGADPSDSSNLSLAAKSQPGILQILLEHIPRPARQVVVGLGTKAIMVTIEAGIAGLPTLEVLLSSKVVDFRSFFRYGNSLCSPLGLAIKRSEEYRGSFRVVVRLLDAGCDPNSVVFGKWHDNPSNLTALLAAIETKNINLVRLLLKHRAEVNTETTRGLTRTPLQRAAELGCLDIVQLLLDEGANVNAMPVQRGGGTALQLAAISGNCNIVVELLKHGADPYALPSTVQGRWPIEAAAEHGRLDMIDFLLKATVYNAEQCKRAMEFAQDNGHMGCRDLILDHVNMNESIPMIF